MIERPLKIGHLHIPKTAGSALNNAIYDALDLKRTHIAAICSGRKTEGKPNQIPRLGLTYRLASNAPFLSGHLTFTSLKELKRDFIFSVLRDPRARVISHFTYNQTRTRRQNMIKQNDSFVNENKNLGFYDFLSMRKSNSMSRRLFADIEGFNDALDAYSSANEMTKNFIELLRNGLNRLDVAYACPIQMILDDLHFRGLIPPAEEVRKNVSDTSINFGDLGSRQQFISKLNSIVWLDMYVYQMAKDIFPETVVFDLPTDTEFVHSLEAKYQLSFSS
jgi:hypothetical protein